VASADGSRGRRAVTGNLEEIGEWSAVVLTDRAIEAGAEVRVRGKGPELKGLVESCTRKAPLGFFVTVRLDAASRWSEQWFAPDHLLELPGYDESPRAMPSSKSFHLGIASGY